MRIKQLFFSLLPLVVVFIIGCNSSDPVDPGVVPEGTRILVANSLGETLSQFTYLSGTYSAQNDIAPTGQAPNQVIVQNGNVYVLNSLSNSLLVLDLTTYTVLFEASVGDGKSPYDLDFINSSEVLITNFMANDCVRMNIDENFEGTDRVIAEIPLPENLPKDSGVESTDARPQDVFVDGNKAYVTMANIDSVTWSTGGPGMVAVIELNSNQVFSTFQTTGRDTVGLCQNPYSPSKLYIISSGDSSLNFETYEIEWDLNGVIDEFDLSSQGITDSIEIEAAPAEMVFGTNQLGYIADSAYGRVHIFDPFMNRVGTYIELAPASELGYISGIDWGPNGILYALQFNNDELAVIDTRSGNQVIERITTGDGPDAITVVWK